MTTADIQRIAAAYPPEAAHTPADERERHFTTPQRLAWDARFCSENPPGMMRPQNECRIP